MRNEKPGWCKKKSCAACTEIDETGLSYQTHSCQRLVAASTSVTEPLDLDTSTHRCSCGFATLTLDEALSTGCRDHKISCAQVRVPSATLTPKEFSC